MIRTNKRMLWCCTLLALNVLFIWGNSLLAQEVSAAFSKLVGTVLEWLLGRPGDISQGQGQGTLRKIAHFTEFMSLGVLAGWLAGMVCQRKWRKVWLPVLSCLLVACADETIQLFVPGRGPGVTDVLIDLGGAVVGICLVWLCARLHRKRKEIKKEPASV